ncbi:DUF5694 domain-containing protein [Galbibacter sp. PAP.153]|uniref:DUF5694 domain-containing protein n=1 Tax=Galbibacter sp. PAP.153 TaxID=3104623 RepID=UPI003009386C
MKPLTVLFLCVTFAIQAQKSENENKIEVLTLATFHFDFPNLDVQQVEDSDKIDIYEKRYQKEINEIVKKLSAFKPTIIAIELRPEEQAKADSLYNLFLEGIYKLQRAEYQQIGFRLAKQLKLKKLYCVDEWGNFTQSVEKVINGNDSINRKKFVKYVENNPDAPLKNIRKDIYKSEGILEQLKMMNNPEVIKKSLGNYLLGPFKYEINEGDFFGVDFETGRWFSRNLKIFRNIQRIKTDPSNRILIIFGADHMNLLNIFFDSSPEFKLVDTNVYLK